MSSLDTRAVDRDSLFLTANLAVEGHLHPVQVRVRNLSTAGMMVAGDVPARTGERVTAELRNIGPVSGVIVWSNGSRFGIAFDSQIDPKLARVEVYGGYTTTPSYARSAVSPRRPASSDGRERPA